MREWLAPFGLAYETIGRLRSELYSRKFFKTAKLSKPVISVGNLTVGGTGKTPVVDAIMAQLESAGKRVGVLTRGYGRREEGSVLLTPLIKPSLGGDEPVWLFKRHLNALISVGADRVSAARNLGDVDVIILDDGFQHFKIHRDLDIVLLDSTRSLSQYHPLPWGLAREPMSSLRRADLIILTRVNQANKNFLDTLQREVRTYSAAPILCADLQPDGIRDLNTSCLDDLSGDLKDKKVYLISGIGNPESFETLVKSMGIHVIKHEKFPDHYNYEMKNIEAILGRVKESGAESLLLTEKDAVKWQEFNLEQSIKIAYLKIKLNFKPDLPNLYDLAHYKFC